MGMRDAPEKCFITQKPTVNISSSMDAMEYEVEFHGKRLRFTFHWDHSNSDFVTKNLHVLVGLIANEKFLPQKDHFLDNEELEKIIRTSNYPRTPRAKLDNLLLMLHEIQENEGSIINFGSEQNVIFFATKSYLKNFNEFRFYMGALSEMNFVSYKWSSTKSGSSIYDISLTFNGFEKVLIMQEDGEQSKNCFIAMSFSEGANKTRLAIKEVVESAGYQPILVDEVHYESDITINDAIIKYIKKSKFLIADFTEQKHGVYFEAGFALGLKRPVIYICAKHDFKNTHFDTNHYPHIVYSDLPELKEKLKNKIEAWID